jgi:hypothetical protein
MQHYRVLKVKYLSPTNQRGGRIKITDEYFGDSITLPYSYKYGDVVRQTEVFLTENCFNIIGYGTCKKDYVFMCDNWGDDAIKLSDLTSFPF